MTAETILKETFGYSQFRPMQKEVIEHVLAKKDTLVIMPTGGGKSMCYSLPALMFDGLTVVVSPLISLMQDQVAQWLTLGIAARFLNSSLSHEAYYDTFEQLRNGKVKILYLAPETLHKQSVMAVLSKISVDCLAIDEAHCISQWGHDFRPDYRELGAARARFNDAVCIALTATATHHVQQDIIRALRFKNYRQFVASFDRPNLMLRVESKTNAKQQMERFLKKYPSEPGIIYCFSRRAVETIVGYLQREGYKTKPYHAGLAEKVRVTHQRAFMYDDIDIIVATVAFGMGINKSNVRFVLHYDLPKSIESYYQEIGRAGRDGLPAECLLLLGYGDIHKINFFIQQKSEEEAKLAQQQLHKLIDFCETSTCRGNVLLEYFGESPHQAHCKHCDNCVQETKSTIDFSVQAQKFLSCMRRTRENYGMMHIINVLRGSQDQKIISAKHHHLSTYAIGKELSRQEWQQLACQLIQKKLIKKDDLYGILSLTPEGEAVMYGRTKFWGKPLKECQSKQAKVEPSIDSVHQDLFLRLKALRRQIADEARVPAFVIFSDRTLIDMMQKLPCDLDALQRVYGIGTQKALRYGEAFLKLVKAHCDSESQSS